MAIVMDTRLDTRASCVVGRTFSFAFACRPRLHYFAERKQLFRRSGLTLRSVVRGTAAACPSAHASASFSLDHNNFNAISISAASFSLDHNNFNAISISTATAIFISFLPIFWLNARQRSRNRNVFLKGRKILSSAGKELTNLSSASENIEARKGDVDAARVEVREDEEEEQQNVDDISTCTCKESSHEFLLDKESLNLSYQDVEMVQVHLVNDHPPGVQGSVDGEKSNCLKDEVQGSVNSKTIDAEMQGTGSKFHWKRRSLEEADQEIRTGKLFVTNNAMQESGFEGSVVNEMSTYTEVHDTEAWQEMLTYNMQKYSAAASSIDLAMDETHSLGNLCSTREDNQTSEKMESDSQHRPQIENHEGNGPVISGAALITTAEKKRIWYKSESCSVDIGMKLKDLIPLDSTKDASEYMRYYDCWLRVGRFKDCLELLESMNGIGALDMNKVYHAKFLEICREKRAVQEAFRFVKLIENPTLSTFNMLLAVCASAEDVEGAFQVLPLVKKNGLKADCKLYTSLISSCAKGGKVDIMFKVFHEMVNAEIEPSIYTYGALIDGCARAGQVAKAFGVYGIMRSKKIKPDRVIFNALITACGRAGAVDRAFDILSEMRAEPHPLDPDHVTVGALINACSQSGQVDRALQVYKMVQEYGIKGTADVYTMAVNACSQNGDLDFAIRVYNEMRKNAVCPDEVFFSALIDVAGHAGDIDFAFKICQDAKNQGLTPGSVIYSSLMGACTNAKNWQKALEVYEEIKGARFIPTVSTFNALITSLCDAGKLHKSIEILEEMRRAQVLPNYITYTVLLVASHKEDEPELAFKLFSRATMDGVVPNLTMCDCVTSLCLRRFRKASMVGQSIVCIDSGGAQIHNQWTSWALLVYRQTISAGVTPTMEALSHVLGCLRMPYTACSAPGKTNNYGINETLTVGYHPGPTLSEQSSTCSFIEGFGIYDPRAFSLYEEAASLGVVPCFPYKDASVSLDLRDMQVHVAEVYVLTILKGLKHSFAAGAQLPNITLRLQVQKVVVNSKTGQTFVNVSGRTGQAVAALLRRLNLLYQGNEAYGKIRIAGKAIKHWLCPKYSSERTRILTMASSFPNSYLAKGIGDQQRTIRTEDFSINRSTSQNASDKFQRPRRWENKTT